ncbi:helix-turn-helix domain-containing protein [Erwiniaceae bacterium BAC15a-03b]|uniref:Helix-turn-helix domain-containing protein n=1 Tax=Winslowiella arboricola TaxID=2978220 RepID=A0A9J6PPT3_9GAMM|nr:helix-turn-helix transcriptional regulator [Winslowiella arboricola]MCU5775290.1 helix-turn-helix domain-containing protein [Winslowiella arboricola]MCU5780313.1 helix-turn-helix domain-containing protein [Winslowiella arboricola]
MDSQDWNSAEIQKELRKRGLTMSGLSRRAGLATSTLRNTLLRPWPKGEWLIADALSKHPSEIWPSRYPAPSATQ